MAITAESRKATQTRSVEMPACMARSPSVAIRQSVDGDVARRRQEERVGQAEPDDDLPGNEDEDGRRRRDRQLRPPRRPPAQRDQATKPAIGFLGRRRRHPPAWRRARCDAGRVAVTAQPCGGLAEACFAPACHRGP